MGDALNVPPRHERGLVSCVHGGVGALRAWVLPVVVAGLLTSGGAAAVVARSASGAGLPDGWRWESFKDVEVAVPGGWGHTSSADFTGCSTATAPTVSRPGLLPLVGCSGGGRQVGQFVAFDYGRLGTPGPPVTVGDRSTVTVGSVVVTVQAPRELREQIMATLRTVERDANGCPDSDPIAADPARRPVPAVDVAGLTGVRSVSACMYEMAEPKDLGFGTPPLFGSIRLDEREAADAVRAIAAAPLATGRQDTPFVSGAAHPPIFSGGPAGKTEAIRGS